ncbi:MAG: 4-hydroxythreonine-4-phosphate dehydrogenase PdxA, partial [Spirochaetales bacterium]|nr:4-hydroxythreonine-4-phosphate dehydrogenase PdxA [Spirochaetales bacterium]
MIAVTMGDPNGVGPEIAFRAVPRLQRRTPILLVGDDRPLTMYAQRHRLPCDMTVIDRPDDYRTGVINVLRPHMNEYTVQPGVLDGGAGAASIAFVDAATRLVLDGVCSAMVTLPVNKEAARLTIPGFTGHTERIAHLCGASSPVMMLVSDRLRITHVSTHVSLAEAINRVTVERVLAVIRTTAEAVRLISDEPGVIAVCGLNPHAGEHGAFGNEEIERIAPAIEAAR